MNYQILFSRKNKKNIISLSSAEFAYSVVSANTAQKFAGSIWHLISKGRTLGVVVVVLLYCCGWRGGGGLDPHILGPRTHQTLDEYFLHFSMKTCFGYSLEMPQQVASNDNLEVLSEKLPMSTHNIFLWRNKNHINIFLGKKVKTKITYLM